MHTSSCECDGVRNPKHLDRTGSITLDGLLQHRIKRHVDACFSIVRRNAACACLRNLSISTNATAINSTFLFF